MSYNVSPEILSYREHLAELKINSKIHINNLTLIAQENPQLHKEIVKEVEERIRTAPSNEKLPSLYLLDSIVKNVGNDYLSEFSKNLVHTFCQAFEAVTDPETRNSMLRLLKTWPAIFPPEKIALIEQRLAHSAPLKPHPSTNRTIHVNPQLFKKQPIAPSPYSMPAPPVSSSSYPHHHHPYAQHPYAAQPPYPNAAPMGVIPPPTIPHSYAQPTFAAPYPAPVMPPQHPYAAYPAPPVRNTYPLVGQQPSQPTPSVDPSSLMKTLGLLSSLAANEATTHAATKDTKVKDTAVYNLYQAFAAQCSNCGLRYHNTEALNAHLDKHFETQSRKTKSKALARKWYQTGEDWLVKVDENVVENPGAFFFNQLKSNEQEDTSNKQQQGNTNTDTDVVADEGHDTCPICHETFERYWNKAREEWVYKNSVRNPTIPNQIVHRSCLPRKREREDEQVTSLKDEPPAKRIKLEM